jgi:hypothetical protein
VVDLIGTTLSISFTRPATFRRRHQSPLYSILYAPPQGLHPNVTFPHDSQMGVSKLGLMPFLLIITHANQVEMNNVRAF